MPHYPTITQYLYVYGLEEFHWQYVYVFVYLLEPPNR